MVVLICRRACPSFLKRHREKRRAGPSAKFRKTSSKMASPNEKKNEPSASAVQNFLLYSLSLPERALRSTAGVAAGTIRESAALLLPRAFQNSKTYSIMVRQMLDFLAEDLGGVARVEGNEKDSTPPPVENFVARKAIGNFIDLAGIATLHLSPIMILAIIGDVAYGSKTYLKELSDELKQEGIIDENSSIGSVDDLLGAVSDASKATAGAFDTPPLSVDGLRETISQTRQAVMAIDPTKVFPKNEVERLWNDLHKIAEKEGVNPFAVSSAMTLYSLDRVATINRGALSTVRVAGNLFDRHILTHYGEAINEIRDRGLYTTLAKTSKPYIDALWQNFVNEKETITEELLTGRLFAKAWGVIRGKKS